MKKEMIGKIVNLILGVMVFTVWILSFFLWREGALSVTGWEDLKYFTVQSNLLFGISCLVYAIYRIVVRKGEVPKWLSILKYVSAVGVFVTFTVVMTFLGPLYGYGMMFSGANLFFHLLIPIFAIIEYVLFSEKISFKETFFAMIPPFVYGVGYLTNCLVNGIGSWETGNRNDWYYFLEWGYGIGVALFVFLIVVAWGLGVALWAGNKVARRIPWEGKE